MRSLFILYALSLVVLSLGNPDVYFRDCIYIMGKCPHECEAGTHAYNLENCGYKTPEATCDDPNPAQDERTTCNFSACYCDPPTVRNTDTNQCVQMEECPKREWYNGRFFRSE